MLEYKIKMLDNIIVIPYRNRQTHLEFFIEHTVPLLKKHMPNSKVVVVEQANDKLFNRGKLLNVVFSLFKTQTKYFITNDVDINPTERTIINYYIPEVENDTVKGILTSPCDTLGGVIKISSDNIHKCNGFPNNIWGWGAEDKALQNRTEFFGIKKETNFLCTSKSTNDDNFRMFNDINDRQPVHHNRNILIHYKIFKKLNPQKKLELVMSSGLKTLHKECYNVLTNQKINDYVYLIKVDI